MQMKEMLSLTGLLLGPNHGAAKRIHVSGKRFSDDEVETEVRKWLSQKTSILRVSTHWLSDGTNISMLVEDISRKKRFFQVLISYVLRFISIYDLFTDSPSYLKLFF
jgi:hypothetical protein